VHGKLNLLLPWQILHSEIRNSFQQQIVLNIWKKKTKCWIAASDFCGAEHCTLQKADQSDWRL